MWFVKYLELGNFKCNDRDPARFNLGNFQHLKAILGQNEDGNSVVMDALAFILGLDWTRHCSDAIGVTTCVTLVCNNTEHDYAQSSTEKTFTRTISDVYQIDGKSVSKKIYLGELHVLGLKAKDRYCLVLEGACVALSTKSRKQQTQILFEVMASAESLSLKEQYEHLQAAIRSKDRELRQLLRVKKHKYYIFKLFHWEIEKLELEKSVEQITQLNRKLKEDVDGKRSECLIKRTELKTIEKEFWKMELNVKNLLENQVAIQECLTWEMEVTNLARKVFEKAENEFLEHKLKTDELRKRIEVCEAQFLEIKCETTSEYELDSKFEAERILGRFFRTLKDLRQIKMRIELELDSCNSRLKYFRIKLVQTEDEFRRRLEQVKCKAGFKRKRSEKKLSANETLFAKNKRAAIEIKRNMETMKNTEAKSSVVNKTSSIQQQHSEYTQILSRFDDCQEKVFDWVLRTIKKEENWESHFVNLIKLFRDKIQENETLIESWREKMNDINGEIAEVDRRMNNIENQIFKDFRQTPLRVNNIKEYYRVHVNRMLRDNCLQSSKKIELRNEIEQLKSQIDYENGTNLKYEEMKLAKELVNLRENDFKATISKEAKQREELMVRVGEFEEVTKSRNIMKAEIMNLEDKIYELTTKSLNLDAKKDLVQLRIGEIVIKRHQLLIKCKEQQIKLFFENGDWIGDVNFYAANDERNYAIEERIKFDFSSLEPNLKMVTANKANGDVNFQQFENIAEKVETDWITFEDAGKKMKNLKLELIEVRSQRFLQFMQMFKHVDSCVDTIYKMLTACGNARAILTLENVMEPYLDGVKYEFVVPGKTKATSEMGMEDRYVAAMALLMATQTFRGPSADEMNEINSGELDRENIEKLANFIQKRNQKKQNITFKRARR